METMPSGIDPSLMLRKIIHFDMDAFYAAVEVKDDPSLKGKPLVIGGSPQSRGVVCTASYEARRFGVRSAMACSKAYRLCPQAIFLPPRFDRYKEVSLSIREIFARYAQAIEPLSLDEAYLDVSHSQLFATQIARRIQQEIMDEMGLSGSAGVAPNKLIAKIASDVHKPFGITVVVPEKVLAFMEQLPLRRIHGIGPASEKRLTELGLRECRDVWPWSLENLIAELGANMGEWLYHRSRGLDDRPVEAHRERKSLGREETFAKDLLHMEELEPELEQICQDLSQQLQRRGLSGKTSVLKVKYADFTSVTRSHTLPQAVFDFDILLKLAKELLLLTEAGRSKIRLLGVSVSNFKQSPQTPALTPLGLPEQSEFLS